MTNQADSGVQAPVDFDTALAALEGDASLLEAVATMLLTQMEEDLQAIAAAVATESSLALAESSHRLKGSLGAISAVPAFLACTALNKSARSRSTQCYASELVCLEHELGRLRICLQAWLKSRS